MKKILKTLAFGAMVTLLTACGEPTLDTSSDKAMKASIQEIMTQLSQEEKTKFKNSIKQIYVVGTMSSFGTGESPEQARAKVGEKLNGMTAEEIFALADEIKAKMKNRG
ncbi:DUF6694 family lipoprotein [Veronia pacifica]|uniref:Lipoprotein n=1 Tax=Veronia pacifica TaxID=1080227 RepID=A0A1C3EL73_9GAMM|nr:DUF6694 family lipoprotein [Veronia pacifica]ODA33970.1 hypothetical protein A8L45_07940 [Veronia pacifica]